MPLFETVNFRWSISLPKGIGILGAALGLALALVLVAFFCFQQPALAQTVSAGDATKAQTPGKVPEPNKAIKSDKPAVQGQAKLNLSAYLFKGSPAISKGVEWRIFSTNIGADGKLPLIRESRGGSLQIALAQGEYLVYVAYGHANATRKVLIDKPTKDEDFVLDCGALQLNAVTAVDTPIAPQYLSFEVYANKANNNTGRRQLIAGSIKPGEIVPFPAGIYHVVSHYGSLNVETRADLKVEAGKVTQATLQQRAARITFRLVHNKGGDAIAGTAWSILTDDGEVISESTSAFPSMVLAEGIYSAIAKNRDTIYSQNFEVTSGSDQDVEIIAQEK